MSSTPVQNSAFYADPASLGSLKQSAKAENPTALREAARQFESLFTQMMLKSMREAWRWLQLTSRACIGGRRQSTGPRLRFRSPALCLQSPPLRGRRRTREEFVRRSSRSQSPPGATSGWIPIRCSRMRRWRRAGARASRMVLTAPAASICSASRPDRAGRERRWGSVPSNSRPAWRPARVERFRSYESPADCFKDYAALLGNSSRYAAAKGAGSDAAAFGHALHKGGYAPRTRIMPAS
jgi:flagellar protein FlgJ